MANKNLFKSAASTVASADSVNLAGGKAYSLSDKQAVAQYAVTGTFNGTFYASADEHLKTIQGLLKNVDPKFIAQLAVYARTSAHMKDMPAFLLADLSTKDIALFKKTFPLVVDNSKLLRNFVQIMRSGVTGRKSLGSAPKKAIKAWFDARTDEQLFNDSVGNDPSLVDVIKMVHVKANTPSRDALFKYLMSFDVKTSEYLPSVIKELEAFKLNPTELDAPKVSFQMLTSLPLSEKHWKKIAQDAKWQMTRMNLNTFARHGVFNDSKMVDTVASRLKNEKFIKDAKVFPYQLFAAYKTADTSKVPTKVVNALQDAIEVAVSNVPSFGGNKKVFVGVDISGSMACAITGNRGTATSTILCNQVAALFAASILKANEDNCEVFQFDTHCKPMTKLNARDSIMTNIEKIAFNGGGTDCSSVIRYLNDHKSKGDLVIIISDNMSWVDHAGYSRYGAPGQAATPMATAWHSFKTRNPGAKLVCLDLVPQTHVQVKPSADVLYVGGFSDSVFDVIGSFVENSKNDPDFFVNKIQEAVQLDIG